MWVSVSVSARVRVYVWVRARLKVLLTRLILGVLHAFVHEWLARMIYIVHIVLTILGHMRFYGICISLIY